MDFKRTKTGLLWRPAFLCLFCFYLIYIATKNQSLLRVKEIETKKVNGSL